MDYNSLALSAATQKSGLKPVGAATNVNLGNGLTQIGGTTFNPDTTYIGEQPAIGGATGNQTYQAPSDPYAAERARQTAATVAMYDADISNLNNQIGNLGQQESIGLNNIASGYNKGVNRLGEQNAVAKRNYDTSTQQNNQNYLQTRSGIQTKVGADNNMLQRLLGMSGSGNSSAAYTLAPYAAARLGTQNLQGAQQTYGRNAQSLDTGWQDTQRSYRNGLEDLAQQKYQQENALRSSIAQTKAGLLDKIAQGTAQKAIAQGGDYQAAMAARDPYTQQINSLLQQITQYGNQYANPILQTGDVAFNAPSLDGYSLGDGRINAGGAANNIDANFAPVIAPQQRDEYGNIIG